MDDFRTNYREFNRDLVAFVELVSLRYKTGAPDALQYVKLIPTVLTTDDRALMTGYIKIVESKFRLLQDVTSHVFPYLQPCVREEFHEWLHSQIKKLKWWMDITDGTLYVAKRKAENDDVVDVSDGVSGVNRGVLGGIYPETWQKIIELCSAIPKFASQMR